jgi:hypothetical protein
MPIPESEDQVQFLFKTQRLLSEGSFVATYAVDHFIPWSRYRLDLGHNYALAHTRCNVDKSDRLAAFDRLKRWHGRNRVPEWSVAVAANALPSDLDLTTPRRGMGLRPGRGSQRPGVEPRA